MEGGDCGSSGGPQRSTKQAKGKVWRGLRVFKWAAAQPHSTNIQY